MQARKIKTIRPATAARNYQLSIVNFKFFLFSLLALTVLTTDVSAQCAMCRSTLENNYSAGNPGIAAGINTGILYLLSMPYLAVLIIGYLWFKSTRNAQKLSQRGIER